MRVEVLGVVRIGGQNVTSARARKVLTVLALHAGRDVDSATLIEAVWGDHAPATANKALQNVVVALRNELGDALRTTPTGYRLVLRPEELDLTTFDQGPTDVALELWPSASELFADLPDWGPAEVRRANLRERHASLQELRLTTCLDANDLNTVIAETARLISADPYRDRLWELLVVGLYRAGRQAEAVERLQQHRRIMQEDLGLDPSSRLRELELAVLRQDDSVVAPATAGWVSSRLSGLCESPWPFVGRDRELTEMLRHWRSSDGKPIAIVSASGAGKSRLSAEGARVFAQEGAHVFYVGFDELPSSAFRPFEQAIAEWSDEFGKGVDGESVPQRRVDVAASSGDDLGAIFERLTSWFLNRAADRHVVVVFDDVQWATPSSAAFLRYLCRRSVSTHLHCLLLARPLQATKELVDGCGCETVQLDDLDRAAVNLLARDVTDAESRQSIWAMAGGNALLATAAIADYCEHGRVGLAPNARWIIASSIDPTSRSVLRSAAVLGPTFSLRSVSLASGLAPDDAFELLDRAASAGVLVEVAVDQWRFHHDLLRSALLDELSTSALARLHSAAALALDGSSELEASELAALYLAAGPDYLDQAVAQLREAADRSLDARAFADARSQFQEIVDLGRSNAVVMVKLATAQAALADPTWLASANTGAQLAEAAGDHRSLIEAALVTPRWTDATGQAMDATHVRLLSRALDVATGPQDRAVLLASWADELRLHHDSQRRRQLCDAALAALDTSHDPTPLLRARVLATVLGATDTTDMGKRHTIVRRLSALREESDDVSIHRISYYNEVSMWVQLGDHSAVDRCLDRLRDDAERSKSERLTYSYLVAKSSIAFGDCQFAAAEADATRALHVGLAIGLPEAATLFGAAMLGIRLHQNRSKELVPLLEPISAEVVGSALYASVLAYSDDLAGASVLLDDFVRRGVDASCFGVLRNTLLRTWAGAAYEANHVAAASILYDELLPYIGHLPHEGPTMGPSADESLALLSIVLKRWDDAECWLENAQKLADNYGSPMFLRTVLAARMHFLAARRGKIDAKLRARIEEEKANARRDEHPAGARFFNSLLARYA